MYLKPGKRDSEIHEEQYSPAYYMNHPIERYNYNCELVAIRVTCCDFDMQMWAVPRIES